MKVRKNLEAVFLAAVVTVSFATFATAEVPAAARGAVQASAASADSRIQVVEIKAKRLSAVEKAQLK